MGGLGGVRCMTTSGQARAWGVQSRAGPGKLHNEDSVLIPTDLELAARPARGPDLLAERGLLFAVADGVSTGAEARRAGELAVQALGRAFYTTPGPDRVAALEEAVAAANSAVYAHARHAGHQTMASTVVAAVVQRDRVIVAHVGDSRAYLWRRGRLFALTHDHTWVRERYDEGLLDEQQARAHPHRHVLTRALGHEPHVAVDLNVYQTQAGDVLLLCSDGLSDVVPEDEIAEGLARLSPQAAAERLVARAGELGAQDDVSAIVVPVGLEAARPVTPPPSGQTGPRPPTQSDVPLFGIFLALLFIGVVGLVWEFVRPLAPVPPAASPPVGRSPGPETATPAPLLATGTPAPSGPFATVSPATASPAAAPPAAWPAERPAEPAAPLVFHDGQHGGEWRLEGVWCSRYVVVAVSGDEEERRSPYHELHLVASERDDFVYELFIEGLQSERSGLSEHCGGDLQGGSITLDRRREDDDQEPVLQMRLPKAVKSHASDYRRPFGDPAGLPRRLLVLMP